MDDVRFDRLTRLLATSAPRRLTAGAANRGPPRRRPGRRRRGQEEAEEKEEAAMHATVRRQRLQPGLPGQQDLPAKRRLRLPNGTEGVPGPRLRGQLPRVLPRRTQRRRRRFRGQSEGRVLQGFGQRRRVRPHLRLLLRGHDLPERDVRGVLPGRGLLPGRLRDGAGRHGARVRRREPGDGRVRLPAPLGNLCVPPLHILRRAGKRAGVRRELRRLQPQSAVSELRVRGQSGTVLPPDREPVRPGQRAVL